jgi:uncharacterized damage-inducible protein DinB
MQSLIDLNLHLVGQAIDHTRIQSADTYSRSCVEVFFSTIGQHLRHCIEHYEEFSIALSENRPIDYENRPRDTHLENSPELAISRLESVRSMLNELPPVSRTLYVSDTGVKRPAETSMDRELLYLASHTVHHFALISVISRIRGESVPSDFGVAPSTLKHRGAA